MRVRVILIAALAAAGFARGTAEAALAWRLLTSDGPSGRTDSAMAYNSAEKYGLLFGGATSILPPNTLEDTWKWDGFGWVRMLVGPNHPPKRHACGGMAFNTDSGQLVMFGGADVLPVVDTWIFANSQWSMSPAITPFQGNGAQIVYDQKRKVMVRYGGSGSGTLGYESTFLFDGVRWIALRVPGPSPRIYPAMCYDPDRQVVVLYGGRTHDPYNQNVEIFYDDTWEWDGTTWRLVIPHGLPGRRNAGGLCIWHKQRRTMMIHGGAGDQFVPAGDTFEYDGRNWSAPVIINQGPGPRYGSTFYDDTRQSLILFGGVGGWPLALQRETWELYDTSMTPLPTATPGPSPTATPPPTATPVGCDPSLMALENVPCDAEVEPCAPFSFVVRDGNAGGVQVQSIEVGVGIYPMTFQSREVVPGDPSRVEISVDVAGVVDSINTNLSVRYTTPCGTAERFCKLRFPLRRGFAMVGGYMTTDIDSASGGPLQLLILAQSTGSCSLSGEARLFLNGIPANAAIPETGAGVYSLSTTLPPSAAGSFLLGADVQLNGFAVATSRWPYLTVER